MPRVSLAMPVFNGEAYIEEAVASILAQTYADFELIITDNASTDGTRAICERFAAADARVRYHRHPKNLGAAPNYNSGYERASTEAEFLKWCAHDDNLSPNYLEACVRALDENPGAALAYGRTQCIDEAGREISMVGSQLPPMAGLSAARRFGLVFREAGTCFEIFGLFRMNVLRRTTLHRFYYGSDRALLAEAAMLGPFVRVESATFYNREHRSRSINIDDKRARRQWQFADDTKKASFEHWSLLVHLLEIAGRHPDAAAPIGAVWQVLAHAATPMQLSRYTLELIGAVSPATQRWLRRRFLAAARA